MTVLSFNNFEDKISLVLVPLLASAGLRILKPMWSDELSGQALFNNLLSIPGLALPTHPEEMDRLLDLTGGVYAAFPESIALSNAAFIEPDPDDFTRFKKHSLFTLYAVDWDAIAVDSRIGDYSNQIITQNPHEFAMELREYCDDLPIGYSFFISNLSQPLGNAIGPSLELKEALDVLKAKGPLDFTKLAIEQGADLLMQAGKFTDRIQAKSFLKNQLQNGAALDRFKTIVQALGGKAGILDEHFPLPLAKKRLNILSLKEGYIQRIAMDRLSDLKHRMYSEHKGAGLILLKKIGDTTGKHDTLAEAYLPSSWDTKLFQTEIQDIISISHLPPKFQPLIEEKIKGSFRF